MGRRSRALDCARRYSRRRVPSDGPLRFRRRRACSGGTPVPATIRGLELPGLRTTVTELATGLGMLGLSKQDALARRPREMVSVSPELWTVLERAAEGGELHPDFQSAWANGDAFFRALDGLRERAPRIV